MDQPRFAPDVELDGLPADEAFAILGNDIRLDVIRVLWRAGAAHEFDDGSDSVETIPYSTLQQAVDIDDNGRFNYHLSQLVPQFVRRTEEGYRLSSGGKQIARTVIAVSGTDHLDVAPALDMDCPLCGGTVGASYEEQWFRVECDDCEGLFGDQAPTGTLFLTNVPAAGMRSRDTRDALAAGLYRCGLDITYLMFDICRECAGEISASVTVCEPHRSKGDTPCSNCGTPFPVWADMRCETCGFAKRLPVEMFVTGLAMITGSLDHHGQDLKSLSFEEAIEVLQHAVETSISKDPLRISITIDIEPTPVTITLDEWMNVLAVDRHLEVDSTPSTRDVPRSS